MRFHNILKLIMLCFLIINSSAYAGSFVSPDGSYMDDPRQKNNLKDNKYNYVRSLQAT
jgi:hypothetical protein